MKPKLAKKSGSAKKPKDPCCEMLCTVVSDPTIPIVFIPKFREYGVRVLDGGSSYIQMKYCPWCRKKLPSSLRTKWFAEMNKLGLEPGDKKIPREYLDDKWYSDKR